MRSLREYSVITATYWLFTLTDGALRMLVLLHLHELGYTPLEIVSLFLLYELFGVVTNLFGGWIGVRYGLRSTLFSGLLLQIAALTALGARADDLTLTIVLVTQAMSGTAKDLTKMSAKSYMKLLVPESDQAGLMRWVAFLTGSKNALKGAGFFLGGVLLTALGFRGAVVAMATVLGVGFVASLLLLPPAPGRASTKTSLADLVSRDSRVNWLSASRLFLFGARDIWFALALPVYLSSALGWAHAEVGAFLALWVIGYGGVQALAPTYLGVGSSGAPRRTPDGGTAAVWTVSLVLPLGGILAALSLGASPSSALLVGLIVFAVLFATDSAVHSYLIVSYADAERVSLSVGFYYMANAAGRLTGTILSGALFQAAGQGLNGLRLCLVGSLLFVLISAALCLPLRVAERKRPSGVPTSAPATAP